MLSRSNVHANYFCGNDECRKQKNTRDPIQTFKLKD